MCVDVRADNGELGWWRFDTDLVTSGSGIFDEEWHFVVLKYDHEGGDVSNIWVDGLKKQILDGNGDPGSGDVVFELDTPVLGNFPPRIGAWTITDWYFVGQLDEFAIWNRALSDTEISQLYNGNTGRSLIVNP